MDSHIKIFLSTGHLIKTLDSEICTIAHAVRKKINLASPSWHCGVDTAIILCTLWVQVHVKALGCVVASRSRAVHLAELPTFVRICCVAPGIQMKISQRKIRKRLLPRCAFTVRVTAVVVISHFIEIMFLGRIWWPHLDYFIWILVYEINGKEI